MPSSRVARSLFVSLPWLLLAVAPLSWSSSAVLGEEPYVAGVDYEPVTAGADAADAESLLRARPELMTGALRAWLGERDLSVPPGTRWGAPEAGDAGASLVHADSWAWSGLLGLGRGLHWADEAARPRAAKYAEREVERVVKYQVEEDDYNWRWRDDYVCKSKRKWKSAETKRYSYRYQYWYMDWSWPPRWKSEWRTISWKVTTPGRWYVETKCGWKRTYWKDWYTVTVDRYKTVTDTERYKESPARRGVLSWQLGAYDAESRELTLDKPGSWKIWLPSSVTKSRALEAGESGDLDGFQVLRHDARDAVRAEAEGLMASARALGAAAGALGWTGGEELASRVAAECEAPSARAVFAAWHAYRGCAAARLTQREEAPAVPTLAALDDRLAMRALARSRLLGDYAWSPAAGAEGGVATVLGRAELPGGAGHGPEAGYRRAVPRRGRAPGGAGGARLPGGAERGRARDRSPAAVGVRRSRRDLGSGGRGDHAVAPGGLPLRAPERRRRRR